MGLKDLLEKMKLVEAEEGHEAPAPEAAPAPSPGAAARRAPAASGGPRSSMGEIIHKVPPARLDEQSLSGGPDIPDFPSIYRASGVKDPSHGFTAYKVLEILSSPDFAGLDGKAKAGALSGFLRMNPSGAVAITDVIQDALARDNALDGFEGFLRMKLDARKADRDKENAALQAGINELTRNNRELIQANLEAIAKEQERFASWQARKRIEEQKLFEAVEPFVEKNPVSVGNSSEPKG